MRAIKVGNAQGFWGDRGDAPAELVRLQPDLDVLTLDYLAEVSLSIMAIQREKDPGGGFAKDFLGVADSLAPVWKAGSKLRLVTNAGGLNPVGCAEAVVKRLKAFGCSGVKIGVVFGDDVLSQLRAGADDFANAETGEPLAAIRDNLVAANAYIGAEAAGELIRQGAQIVIAGRMADPSMAVSPCLAEFDWKPTDYSPIAGATVAGHLIECGAQMTGGIFTNWLAVPARDDIGFPIVEIAADGSCVATKPARTGGCVTERTVKEQLVYEIGDPECYLSPDARVNFANLKVANIGPDRVRVTGAVGSAPTDRYKVSASYRAGYRVMGMLTVVGRDAAAKARAAGAALIARLERRGLKPVRALVECLGTGDAVGRVLGGPPAEALREVVMRICLEDPRQEVCEELARNLAPLVTAGPPGVTGYAEGRPNVRPVFGYWPCTIPRNKVALRTTIMSS